MMTFVINAHLWNIFMESADLSSAVYSDYNELTTTSTTSTTTTATQYEYDTHTRFQQEEPDACLVAQSSIDGRCYAAFRGTGANVQHWQQNLDLQRATVCADGTASRSKQGKHRSKNESTKQGERRQEARAPWKCQFTAQEWSGLDAEIDRTRRQCTYMTRTMTNTSALWILLSALLLVNNNVAALSTRTTPKPAAFAGFLGQLWKQQSPPTTKTNYANSDDEAFPWKFNGRCIFVPAICKANDSALPDDALTLLNVAGWTVGGTVVLEYDESPVGYYREWVTLGGLALYQRQTRGQISWQVGQFGSALYVSKPAAETLCQQVWGLKALGADIQFVEDDNDVDVDDSSASCMRLQTDGKLRTVTAWDKTKTAGISIPFKYVGLLWTPTIKAIWTCLAKFANKLSPESDNDNILDLNRLRLSGRVRLLPFDALPQSNIISFPIGLAVQDLVIEISPSIDDP